MEHSENSENSAFNLNRQIHHEANDSSPSKN
jgi:hypothetical protein